MTTHVSYSDLRQNLARYMDEAIEGRAPLVITRSAGKGNVVLLSEEEFEGWQETVHLLSSPTNAARLLRSVQALNDDHGVVRELIDPDASA